MTKNQKFTGAPVPEANPNPRRKQEVQPRDERAKGDFDSGVKTFRQDFRGTRVFVQGIPPHIDWPELKDHFKQVGEVVFASVSIDKMTGEPKGHGVVQFETTDMAQTAIAEMRNFPLDGSQLYVRPDVQERGDKALQSVSPGGNRGPTQPSKWKCADEDMLEDISEEDYREIRSLIKARDDARRKRNYDVSDDLREELKFEYGVHVDDRLKMWWMSVDGRSVPQAVHDVKGEGKWVENMKPWRQIPTTPENDACVDPDLVEGLLKQRDISRREKDFGTADRLLEEARTAPDGELYLRIHDESRTWRIWTEAPPPREVTAPRPPRDQIRELRQAAVSNNNENRSASVTEECLALVQRVAPEKVPEIREMLKQFPGREKIIFDKVRQRFGNSE